MLVTYIDDPEPWEKASIGADGRGLAEQHPQFLAVRDGQRSRRCAALRRSAGGSLRSQRARQVAGACASSRPTTKASSSTASRRSARLGVRRLPAPRRVLPPRRQGRPDHLRRLPGQPEGHHHRLPRERGRDRSGRASAGLAGRRARRDGAVRQRADPVEIRVPHRQPGSRQALSAARVRLGALLRAGASGGARRAAGRACHPDVRAPRHREDRGRADAAREHHRLPADDLRARAGGRGSGLLSRRAGSTSRTSSCSTGAGSISCSISARWSTS